ncbi:MAG: 50S ribosomal protein L25 [Candidatus Berkelbacteria bacterium]|nr:50S ribosomal protein L25 [Candidatus Berkelbacteria bacterium]
METILLKAEPREIFGKKVKSLREKGQIPAVLYGHKIKPLHLSINKSDFEKVYKTAGVSSLVDIKIKNEQAKKVLIHEPQTNPITSEPIHVDFYQVKMTEKITTEIPLKFIGEAPVVKEQEGVLITNRDSIEVQCLPDALVHEIEVDISNLKTFEDDIKIANLNISEGIEVLNDPEEVVVSITPPRSEEELAELEAPAEEKVEEVEEVEKKEEEEESIEEEKPTEEPEKILESKAQEPEKPKEE